MNSDAICEVVDDFNPEGLFDRMYENLMSGDPKFEKFQNHKLIRMIQEFKAKNANDPVTLSDFREFVRKLQQIHRPCGKECIHLMRFFMRLGFVSLKYFQHKKAFRLPKHDVKPFKSSSEELPKIK